MPHILAGLLALLQLLTPLSSPDAVIYRLQSGQWLRFHVVAHDDSEEMQRLKLVVRDAVQARCRECREPVHAMFDRAQAFLPELTEAALAAARNAGFTGDVSVTLGKCCFDERELMGLRIPAGQYPALVIRLGQAQGHNWWGLLDPETSLLLAAGEDTGEPGVIWDWSLRALLAALFGWTPPTEPS